MDYKEIELHGRKIRYFNEEHIETEFRNKKGDWRKVDLGICNGYLAFRLLADKSRIILIHRLVFWINNPSWDIYDSSRNNVIDHFDGNTTNNKIDNLSCVTHQENLWNIKKTKGYHWCKKREKWCAAIKVNYKNIHLGYFEKEEDAHNAYIKAKLIYHVIKPKTFA